MALMGSRKRVKPNPPGGDSPSSLNQEPSTDGNTPTAKSQEQGSERGNVSIPLQLGCLED